MSNLQGGGTCTVDEVIGMRKNPMSIGKWDGAYVAFRMKTSNGQFLTKSALFEDRKDFVMNPGTFITWDQAIEVYNKVKTEGWHPMSAEDIQKTSGMVVGNSYCQSVL